MNAQALMFRPELTVHRRNRLLDHLDGSDVNFLAPHLTYVELPGGASVATLGDSGRTVCFPLTLIASIGQSMTDGSRFDVGLVGAEGMIGWSALLGGQGALDTGVAQVGGGSALVAPAGLLAERFATSATLRTALLAFVQSVTVQMSHTIVTNLRDGVDRRLARWLLMLHDRVEGDVLSITHGELAAALHVRRASITDTLHVLEGDRVVRCTRGLLTIRDRAALRAIAGDSYGPAEASYRALIGNFGKD